MCRRQASLISGRIMTHYCMAMARGMVATGRRGQYWPFWYVCAVTCISSDSIVAACDNGVAMVFNWRGWPVAAALYCMWRGGSVAIRRIVIKPYFALMAMCMYVTVMAYDSTAPLLCLINAYVRALSHL